MHSAFNVVIGVDARYEWLPLDKSETPRQGDLVTEVADGRIAVRKLVDTPTYTTVSFHAGAIESIMDDREAAKLPEQSFNRLVAEHIEDAVMPHHAPRGAWLSITCEQDQELEQYLQIVFDLPRKEKQE